MDRCKECRGRLDRPGLFGCDATQHSAPTVAQRIVQAIERDLRNRSGLRQEFEAIESEIQDQIRDVWAGKVERILREG